MPTSTHLLAITVTVVGLVGSACGAASGTTDVKAGGTNQPLVITIADSQGRGRPSNLPLETFAKEVASLSKGTMTVQIETDVSPDPTRPAADEPVIKALQAGTYSMAVIPTRAWSSTGVQTLRPLQAPFLFQSEEQVAAAIRDPGIAGQLFSGLDKAGVHGLTMFPESLRHLFSFTGPILTPADAKGRTIRVVSSAEVATLMTAFGARPVDPPSAEFRAGVADGTITASDGGFVTALDTLPGPATATGNLILYPKVISLAANGPFWTGLTGAQRTIINTAANDTSEHVIADWTPDAKAAQAYCAAGGTVALADDAGLKAFRIAAAGIYDDIASDAARKQTLQRIEAIVAATPTTSNNSVAECGAKSAVPTTEPAAQATPTLDNAVADSGAIRDGIYRFEWTKEFLQHHKETDDPAMYAPDWEGVVTVTLDRGHITSHDEFAHPELSTGKKTSGDDAGIVQVIGDQIYFPQYQDHHMVQATWHQSADGTLTFDVVHEAAWTWLEYIFDVTWTRVGDLPG